MIPTPIAGQNIAGIVEHYDRIIRALPRPPIIMGHSFGGLIVQLLVDRGLGAAAVGVHPAPVKGVFKLPLTTLRSGFSILRSPANRHRAVPFTPDDFHYAFGNTMSREDSDAGLAAVRRPGRRAGALRERVRQPRPALPHPGGQRPRPTGRRCC